jgi:hypothetical protein
VGGLGFTQNWEQQKAWLEQQIEKGQKISRQSNILSHIDADKMQAKP